MLALEKVKKLYIMDASKRKEVTERFESLGALGEFGWRYLIKKKGNFESGDAVRDRVSFQKKLTENMIKKHIEYGKQMEVCLQRGLHFGECLEQARDGLGPLSSIEKEIVELSLKWTALENIISGLSGGEPLESLAGNWHVSEKCIREIYYDFPEVMVSDYIGNDVYQMLSSENKDRMKVSFLKVLANDMSIQEYAFLTKGLKDQTLKRIRSFNEKDFFELPKDQVRSALVIFLEYGGRIDEKTLIALTNEKGITQAEMESLISLAAHHG